jgi:hypothetical protein
MAPETMKPTHRKKVGSGMRNEAAAPLKKANGRVADEQHGDNMLSKNPQ